jgi:uncharacterized protein
MLNRLSRALAEKVPSAIAIYAFGSQARGDANRDSDIDLAVLPSAPLNPVERWKIQEDLAHVAGVNVDLVDLRSASTVMRVSVLKDAVLLFESNRAARELFEALALSAYARFNQERAGILLDVKARGSVYG